MAQLGGVLPGERALALVAAFSLVASMCPGAAALAFANGELTAGIADDDFAELKAQAGLQLEETEVNANTHQMKTGLYVVKSNVTINPDSTGNGIQVEKGARVLLFFEEGATLTVNGTDANGTVVGQDG